MPQYIKLNRMLSVHIALVACRGGTLGCMLAIRLKTDFYTLSVSGYLDLESMEISFDAYAPTKLLDFSVLMILQGI